MKNIIVGSQKFFRKHKQTLKLRFNFTVNYLIQLFNLLSEFLPSKKVLIPLLNCLIIFSNCADSKKNKLADCAFAQGDIIFRQGTGIKSIAVLRADSAGLFSHVGILVKVDGAFKAVHLSPGEKRNNDTEEKVIMEEVSDFFAPGKARSGAIMRFVDSSECGISAARYASKKYDEGLNFDHNYDLSDTTRMYCTEFVWHAYLQSGRDITQNRRSVVKGVTMFSEIFILPSDIYKNQKLQTIYKF